MRSSGIVLDVDGSAVESLKSKDRYHHTLASTDCVFVRSKAGKDTFLNGTTSFVDCGNDASLNITNDLTIEAWLNCTQFDMDMQFISKDHSSDRGFYLGITILNKQRISVAIDSSNNAYFTTTCTFTDGWHHVVGVYDGITLKLYKDGISLAGITTGIVPAIQYNSGNPIWIGARTSGEDFFNGIISSVKIYNYVLSPTEIKCHYLEKAYLHIPHPVRIP